jgi:hypothetical protein
MENRLLSVGDKFRNRYRKVNGAEFYGQMLDIPDTSRVSNFLSARRYLRTGPKADIKPTDVVVIDATRYIVAEHGTGFYKSPIYKHFKLFEADTIGEWYKVTQTENTLTGIYETQRTLQAIPVYISTQPKSLFNDSLKIQQQAYQMIVNVEVERNDILNGLIVTKVDKQLGIFIIEAKEQ